MVVVVLAVVAVDLVVPLVDLVKTTVVVGELRKTRQSGISLTHSISSTFKWQRSNCYCFLI